MKARVEQVALRYRLPVGAPRVHAQLPSIERALHARLADEIASQLEAVDEGSDEVIVVREATVRVTLRVGEHARDAAALERVSHAAREAVVALLARPADDEEQVRRFDSDAAYAGAFVLELLGGTAWDRWYFDGFVRFRRADPATTIVALLADADTECIALFAWLEQRGRLAEVLRLVGPSAARALASVSSVGVAPAVPPADLAPLAVAAFAIADALGVRMDESARSELLAEYFGDHAERPAWTDRRALTEWTWRFTRWLIARESPDSSKMPTGEEPPPELVSLLAGQLDWLDGETILARVEALRHEPPAARLVATREHVESTVAPRHAAQLESVAQAISRGALRLDLRTESRDQLLLRMLAVLHSDDASARTPPDASFVAILDEVVGAALTLVAGVPRRPSLPLEGEATPQRRIASTADAPALAPLERVRELGPEAVALLRALVERESGTLGDRSSYAGIYLLTRPIADLRLDRLAERVGVPWAPLLSALAMKLLGAAPPYDEALRIWVGASDADVGLLEESALASLQRLVFRTLADQRQLAPEAASLAHFEWRGESWVAVADDTGTCWPLVAREGGAATAQLLSLWYDSMSCEPSLAELQRSPTTDLDALPAAPALSPICELYVTSLATCVLRAMSHWLPGLGGSSLPFLVRNSIARGGTVSSTEDEISVVLDRAPLDVVLEMAGCFSPLTSASWLGRGVRISLAGAES